MNSEHVNVSLFFFKTTGYNIKWDQFDILASGKAGFYCNVKRALFIQELQPALIECQC